MATSRSLHQILEVAEEASFNELRKAYYLKAKACHPDLHGGSKRHEEAFKELVHAFDVLSDPLRRKEYDKQLAFHRDIGEVLQDHLADPYLPTDGRPVMDSISDDILEELVVGNDLPERATLQTLMRDLEGTERFIRFREGKTALHRGDYRLALKSLSRSVNDSPGNILYHFYLGKAYRLTRQHSKAMHHFNRCLNLGTFRSPPQYLNTVRQQKKLVKSAYIGPVRRFLSWFKRYEEPDHSQIPADQQMIESMSRIIGQELKAAHKKQKNDRKQEARRLLRGSDGGMSSE